MIRIIIAIGALLGAAAHFCMLSADAPPRPLSDSLPAAPTAGAVSATSKDPPPGRAPVEARELSGSDAELLEHVRYKYRFLARDSYLNAASQSVHDLLLAREASCRLPDRANAEYCDGIERSLRAELHPSDYARYELLKDSDAELNRVSEYADGIRHYAALTEEQEHALLDARLKHRHTYQTILRDLGIEGDNMLPANAHLAAHALQEYKANLLAEMQSLLDPEQFALLGSYESTELEMERQRLLAAVN